MQSLIQKLQVRAAGASVTGAGTAVQLQMQRWPAVQVPLTLLPGPHHASGMLVSVSGTCVPPGPVHTQAVFDLPSRMRAAVEEDALDTAVSFYAEAQPLLKKYAHRSAFK